MSRWLIPLLVLFRSCTMGMPAYACDSFPITQGTLVRTYEEPNGLVFREYDTSGDGKADYGTAHIKRNGKEHPFPMMYGVGYDLPDDTSGKPFVALRVYRDLVGNGDCKDIVIYKDVTNPDLAEPTPKEKT